MGDAMFAIVNKKLTKNLHSVAVKGNRFDVLHLSIIIIMLHEGGCSSNNFELYIHGISLVPSKCNGKGLVNPL